jgi:hypothetical protein
MQACLCGVESGDLNITNMDTVNERRVLSVGTADADSDAADVGVTKRRLDSAVSITFTTTTTLENSGYNNASALAEGLEAEVTAAYANHATATAFKEKAKALGSTTVDSTTVVVFEEPVLDSSSITEEVVNTSTPTVTPSAVVLSSDGDNDEQTVILIAVLVSIFVLIVVVIVAVVKLFVYIKHDKNKYHHVKWK